jgi:hypothetical protein
VPTAVNIPVPANVALIFVCICAALAVKPPTPANVARGPDTSCVEAVRPPAAEVVADPERATMDHERLICMAPTANASVSPDDIEDTADSGPYQSMVPVLLDPVVFHICQPDTTTAVLKANVSAVALVAEPTLPAVVTAAAKMHVCRA